MESDSKATNPMSAAAPESPWVEYLTGRKKSPDRFLSAMEKSVIPVSEEATEKNRAETANILIPPGESEMHQFAKALAAKQNQGVQRLLDLLQASATASDTLREIIMDLTEASIIELGVIDLPEPTDPEAFCQEVSKWLKSTRKKPVSSSELNMLLVFIHFGWHRQVLVEGTAWQFLTSACAKPEIVRTTNTQDRESAPVLLDALLATPAPDTILPLLLPYFGASQAVADDLNGEVQALSGRIEQLNTAKQQLAATTAELRTQIGSLREQTSMAEANIAQLERQAIESRASYLHKLDDTRGHIRGVLEGQLTRWLQTSLTAVRASPPRTEVIEERLEEALRLIEREIEWLHPSG